MYRHLQFGLILLAAALNRETAVLLALMFALLAWGRGDQRERRWSVAYLLLSISVFALLRLVRGSVHNPMSPAWALRFNLTHPDDAMVVILFMVLMILPAALNYRHADPFARALTAIIPVFLGLYGVFAVWRELRVIWPLVPVFMALGFSSAAVRSGGERLSA